MSIVTYKVEQFVKTVNKSFHVTVFETPCERAALMTFDDYKRDHPNEYFEILKIETNTTCLGFTPMLDNNE